MRFTAASRRQSAEFEKGRIERGDMQARGIGATA